MPNEDESEFQKLLDQAMSQAPDIVTIGELKGNEANNFALASVPFHCVCISNIEQVEMLGKRLYGRK